MTISSIKGWLLRELRHEGQIANNVLKIRQESAFGRSKPHILCVHQGISKQTGQNYFLLHRHFNKVSIDLEGCQAYIDNVIIYSDTWEEHLRIIREFFQRLSRAMLTINLSKSEFGQAQVTYLGHIVGQGEVKPVSAKVESMINFPRPERKKQLMRFLGIAGYYLRFCPNFAAVAEPLTQLLSKRVKFLWSDRCDEAFEELEALSQSAPVLTAPDFKSSFKLAVDANDVAAGAVLLQEDDEGVEHPCATPQKSLIIVKGTTRP